MGHNPDADGTLNSRYLSICRAAILLAAAAPIVLFPGFLFPFVTTRNIYFRFCVELALAALLLAGTSRLRDARSQYDPILKWFFAYIIAISMAAVAGLSPWHSVFGDFERMGGVFAWIHLFLFYFVLRIVMRQSDWVRLFRTLIAVADLAVIWGAMEFLPTSIRNPLFRTTLEAGSTVGNPGLFAPYLLLALAIGCLLLLSERSRSWRGFAAASAVILLFGIGGARNRSSELGLLFGTIVGATIYFVLHTDPRRVMRQYVIGAAILACIGGVGLLLPRWVPTMADRFAGRWSGFLASPVDHSRTIEWKIAWDGFKDRPILGYGPENHQIISSHHFDPLIYKVLGGANFDRTHNAWLESLATTGLIGTLAMLGIWFASILVIRTGVRSQKLRRSEAAIISGAMVGYAVYLTFWFFDINSVMVWVGLLAFLTWRVYGPLELLTSAHEASAREGKRRGPLIWAMVGLVVLTAYLQGLVPLIAAHNLSAAAEAGVFAPRLEAFEKVMDSSAPQTLHTFPLYYTFLRSTSRVVTAPGASPFLRREFDLALQRGMIEADRSISRNSQDDRSYVDAARFSMLAAMFYRDSRYLVNARNELRRAVTISPRRADARVFLSSVLESLRDSAGAAAQLDSAILLAPEYGAAYFFAGKSAIARNEPDSAAALIASSIDRDYAGNELVLRDALAALEQRGEYARAARLDQRYLEKVYGPLTGWRGGKTTNGSHLTPVATLFANQLPLFYLKAGEATSAVGAALAFARADTLAIAAARVFASQVRTGTVTDWKKKTYLLAPPRE